MRKPPLTPAPQPDPAGRWCTDGAPAFSLVLANDAMAPIYRRGATVYCSRSHRIRARGGEYILTTGTGTDQRFALVHVERATSSTFHGKLFGWEHGRRTIREDPVNLPRSTWRVAFRVRGVSMAWDGILKPLPPNRECDALDVALTGMEG